MATLHKKKHNDIVFNLLCIPATHNVYARDRLAKLISRTETLCQKMHMKLAI